MTLEELFVFLRRSRILLWREGESLRFKAPTGALTPALREQLARHKSELLSRVPVGSTDLPVEASISEPQLALWYVYLAMPDTPEFNVGFAGRIQSEADAPLLERAISTLTARHGSLRTTYHRGLEPYQRVHATMAVDFAVVDASDWSEEKLDERVQEAHRLLFDLERGPLLRVRLFSKSKSDHVLLLTAHHIAVDGWSVWQLLDELRVLYGAEIPIGGQSSSSDYLDFVQWQQGMLDGRVGEDHRQYWCEQLEDVAPVLQFPTNRRRPTVRSIAGASYPVLMPADLTDQLKALARSEGVSLYTLLLTTYYVLLNRYTGQSDIVVGSVMSGRTRQEFENTLGCFVNTLPLRARVQGDQRFTELLHDVKTVFLGASEHQDYPFRRIVTDLEIPRNASIPPLIQVEFVFQKPHRFGAVTSGFSDTAGDTGVLDFGGLALKAYPLPQQAGQLDLTLELIEVGAGELAGSIKYDTNLFDSETIAAIADHYERLLQSVVSGPDTPVSDLGMLTDRELTMLLETWNGTSMEYSRDCISLFERNAEVAPTAKAVVSSDGRMSYGELDQRANRLASHLARLGAGPGSLVGIQLDRSADMVVAVLAVWKAGGAYVPLDPTLPAHRLNAMRADAGVLLMVTRSDLAGDGDFNDVRLIQLDLDSDRIAKEPGSRVTGGAKEDDLAYVIYTSGTTGKPKGVMVTQGALANAYHGWESEYSLRKPTGGHLQMAKFSFDVSIGDFVRALCSGGYLVLVEEHVLLSPPRLYDLMRREAVTYAEFVPAVFRILVGYLEETGQTLEFMRLVAVGSDTWVVREFDRAKSLCGPSCRLVNSYGLTEATIDSTYFEGATTGLDPESVVPIGRPFPNTAIYLLDRHRNPVPVGVPGELYIGGAGVAEGYFNSPELTSDRFVDNPFAPAEGARLFRTGDLAKRSADGNIHLLGRTDHQVKLRGFRIELQEIESALLRLDGVEEAVAVLREDTTGDKRLVAYWVGSDSGGRTVEEMRSSLGRILPDYMVPSAIVLLETLPLTPNGKLDRTALPAPDRGEVLGADSGTPPSNPVEATLVEFWEAMLGVGGVGIHDDFFKLGGHSILVMQLVERVRRTFHVDVGIPYLFGAPTVAHLAREIEFLKGKLPSPSPDSDAGEEREELIL